MKLKPDCEWFLENTASPPVEKMIDYVTTISDFTISKSDLDDIKNIVSIRNKMVHAGIFKLEYSKVNSYLVLIKMILITFDEYVI